MVQIVTVPINALQGENMIQRSCQMPWYKGPTLLEAIDAIGSHSPSEPRANQPDQVCSTTSWHDSVARCISVIVGVSN